jgi:drug/metabolite transporter (DMT)-like permease
MKWVLVAAIVVATVLSDLLQSHEMKQAGEQSVSAHGLARLLHTIAQRRLLILGIACNAVSFFAFMALVQTEPLSFAVPVSSASYVLETVLAKFVLHEHISARRAAGALAVLAGVVLVGG